MLGDHLLDLLQLNTHPVELGRSWLLEHELATKEEELKEMQTSFDALFPTRCGEEAAKGALRLHAAAAEERAAQTLSSDNDVDSEKYQRARRLSVTEARTDSVSVITILHDMKVHSKL